MSMCYWCRRNSYCQAMEKAKYKAVNDGVMYCEVFNPVALPVISMGRTSPPWVNEEKSVTRRYWSKSTSRLFRKDAYYIALSKQRQFGGQAIGIGRMTADPFKQSRRKMRGYKPYVAEGFEYLDDRYEEIFPDEGLPLVRAYLRWHDADISMTVVPFEIKEVFPGMMAKYSSDEEIMRCVKDFVKVLP